MGTRALLFLIVVSVACICGTRTAAAQSCVAAPSGLVAWYTGDQDTSDLTGTHNPSATNAVTIVPGRVSNGFTFGSGGYVEVPHSDAFALQTLTLQAWVRPDGPGPNNDAFGGQIITKQINRLSGVQSSFFLTWSASSNRFTFGVQSAAVFSSNTYPPGQFYHVAGTYDGSVMRLYVNGVLDNELPLTETIEYDPTVPLTIGSSFSVFRNEGFPRTWNGVIDEVQVIGGVLSDAEIQSIYAADVSGYCKVPTVISPLTATATVGQPFVYVLETDVPISTYFTDPNTLPAGLIFDAVPRAITGVPEPNATGTFQVPFTVSNAFGTGDATLTITVQPAASLAIISGSSATGRTGEPFRFQVITSGGSANTRLASGGLPPGLNIDSVTGVIAGTPAADGSYGVTLTATDGSATASETLQLTFSSDPALPVIVSPTEARIAAGESFFYVIDAPSTLRNSETTFFELVGNLPPGLGFDATTGTISGTYSGNFARRGGSKPLSGGVITNVQLFATNSRGTTTTPLVFFLKPTGVVNISTRLAVQTGENVMIGGFIITGNAPKKLIIRAIGPSVDVEGRLEDPVLELYDSSGLLGSNDDWRSAQEQEIIDTTVAPANDRESAIVATLNPGAYTAVVKGKDETQGIGLVELYDLGTASLDSSSAARLANISTRGIVQRGADIMIGGFIVTASSKLIVRAIGPSLGAAGVDGALENTTLEVRDGSGELLAANDDWRSNQEQDIIDTTVPPSDNLESAIVATFSPGRYTALVRGRDDTTGVALVEAYVLQ